VKGVGSMRRAILRGGLRLRGGTTISSEVAAKIFEFLVAAEEDEVFMVALEGGMTEENADDDATAAAITAV